MGAVRPVAHVERRPVRRSSRSIVPTGAALGASPVTNESTRPRRTWAPGAETGASRVVQAPGRREPQELALRQGGDRDPAAPVEAEVLEPPLPLQQRCARARARRPRCRRPPRAPTGGAGSAPGRAGATCARTRVATAAVRIASVRMAPASQSRDRPRRGAPRSARRRRSRRAATRSAAAWQAGARDGLRGGGGEGRRRRVLGRRAARGGARRGRHARLARPPATRRPAGAARWPRAGPSRRSSRSTRAARAPRVFAIQFKQDAAQRPHVRHLPAQGRVPLRDAGAPAPRPRAPERRRVRRGRRDS